MKPDGGKVGNDRSALSEMARYSGHGLTLALAMGLFLALGWWLDGRLGTTPALTIVGALVGAGAGFYHMLHHLLFLPRAEAKREAEAKRRGEPQRGGEPEREGEAEPRREAEDG